MATAGPAGKEEEVPGARQTGVYDKTSTCMSCSATQSSWSWISIEYTHFVKGGNFPVTPTRPGIFVRVCLCLKSTTLNPVWQHTRVKRKRQLDEAVERSESHILGSSRTRTHFVRSQSPPPMWSLLCVFDSWFTFARTPRPGVKHLFITFRRPESQAQTYGRLRVWARINITVASPARPNRNCVCVHGLIACTQ